VERKGARIAERNAGGNGANDRKRSLRKQSSGTTDRANTANSASTSLQKDLPTPRAASEHSDVDSIGDDGYATPGMVRMPAQEVYEHSDMPEELLVQSRKEVTLRRLRRSDIVRTEEEKKVLDAVYATLKFGRAMICPYCEEEDATMVSTSRIRESRTQTWKCQSCNMKISGFHAEKWILYNWPKLCKRYEVYLSKDGTDGDKAAWKAWGITDRQFDQNRATTARKRRSDARPERTHNDYTSTSRLTVSRAIPGREDCHLQTTYCPSGSN